MILKQLLLKLICQNSFHSHMHVNVATPVCDVMQHLNSVIFLLYIITMPNREVSMMNYQYINTLHNKHFTALLCSYVTGLK